MDRLRAAVGPSNDTRGTPSGRAWDKRVLVSATIACGAMTVRRARVPIDENRMYRVLARRSPAHPWRENGLVTILETDRGMPR